jgi:hypothetical protein
MGLWLAQKQRLMPQDKMWLVLSLLGVLFAIAVLSWIAVKLRSLYQEDEGPTGETNDFLGQLNESLSEGEVSSEEYRSIQRRLLEQKMGLGDSTRSTRSTPAKSADVRKPPNLIEHHDDSEDHSP